MKKLSLILETNWKSNDRPNHLDHTLRQHYDKYDDNDQAVIRSYTTSSEYMNGYAWNRHQDKKYPSSMNSETNQEFILPRGTKLKYRGTQTHQAHGSGPFTDKSPTEMVVHEHNMDIVK